MINLISPELRAEIRAARTNTLLVRYISIIIVAVVFIMGVLFVSYTVLERTKASADGIVQANDVKAGIYSETKQQVDALSAKLSESKTVLDQEVRYSKVLTSLGQAMPAGTILDSLKLDDTSFAGTPLTLKVYAKTSNDAVTVQPHLQSSGIFSQVTVQSTDTSKGIDGYPVSVTLSATLTKQGIQ
ncbi:MAG TPA: PilN domain-containing protein [Dongiaceae bacterium]|nr:PilN domain-containing protein [Dongiaceae bacterium]